MPRPQSQRSQTSAKKRQSTPELPGVAASLEKSTGPVDDSCFSDILERFRHEVGEFEKAEGMTIFEMLVERGVTLPAPSDLSDAELTAVLKRVIDELARCGVYLCSTNHLSDRQLYVTLWSDVLHESRPGGSPPDEPFVLDLVGSGTAEDIVNWLRYYADEESRAFWQSSFPEEPILPHEKPPYDRDRHLPRPRSSRRSPGRRG